MLFAHIGKAAIFSIFLTSVYLFFGAFHDFLKKFSIRALLTSYTFLLPILVISAFVIFFTYEGVTKSGRIFIRYYKWLMAILIILQIASSIYHFFQLTRTANNISAGSGHSGEGELSLIKRSRTFIFIVLDGYTSSSCLREEFKYANGAIDSLLRKNKFFISTKSMSNYNVTPFSLSSTLDMDFLKPGIETKPVSTKLFLQATETLKEQCESPHFLVDQGYQVKNYGCFDFAHLPAAKRPYFNNSAFNQIDNQTFWSRVKSDIGWNFTTEDLLSGSFRFPPTMPSKKNITWKGTNSIGIN